MVYPASDSKTDPQCTCSHSRSITNHLRFLGANTPANTLALIEMDIGIIAASLVLMRPCFQALYSTILRRIVPRRPTLRHKLSDSGNSSDGMSNQGNSSDKGRTPRKDNIIVRTIDIQVNEC